MERRDELGRSARSRQSVLPTIDAIAGTAIAAFGIRLANAKENVVSHTDGKLSARGESHPPASGSFTRQDGLMIRYLSSVMGPPQ